MRGTVNKFSTTTALRPPASNAPTQEFIRHYAVEPPQIDAREFRPGWRVKSHLAQLVESGDIGRDELAGGLAWRSWTAALGSVRVQSWVTRVHRSLALESPSLRQVDAARSLQAAAAALGETRTILLHWVCTDDRSWRVLSKRLGLHHNTVKGRAVEALTALALWRAGRPVPSPPQIRPRVQPSSW